MCKLDRIAAVVLFVAVGPSGFGTPSLRDCAHAPPAPRPGQPVTITAQATPGVTNLVLDYQLVDPGGYIELKDPAFLTNWLSQPMRAGRSPSSGVTFQAELPGSLQTHRRLVRYRFRGMDDSGLVFTFPSTNDPSPNYAYFVNGGVPAWTAAINPRSSNAKLRAPVTFTTNVMGRVQSYYLIARADTVEKITWKEQTGGRDYRYTGTLVVDGVVYDHTRLRARGGGWRYAMGKNMWKFDLPKEQPLPARNDYGRPYPAPWDKVNLRACIQQGDYGHRGEQGMFETVGFRLFNLAGVAAPFTHWIQLRIVTDAEEAPPDQYRGDYWGLYLAFQEVDGRFLKAHRLPDGNIYKMEGGGGTPSHQAKNAATDRSDLARFMEAYQRSAQPESWWRSHLDLPAYYSYRAICECIHHYDIGDGKNYFYYLNPRSACWQVVPWDIDLTWADNMYGSGEEPFKSRVLANARFRLEYQNRLRELRDLLFNPAETGRLIDECAAIVADPAGGPSPVDADRAKWDFHPVMAIGGKAGQGLFYQIAPSKDFKGMVQLMREYVRRRGDWIDRDLLRDAKIPSTPVVTYTGPPNYPPDKLSFRASEFRGSSAFAAVQWRLAEIAPPALQAGRPVAPGKYEIIAVWESGELTNLALAVTLPADAAAAGHAYRARVRVKDQSGRCSHWSEPVEFVAGP